MNNIKFNQGEVAKFISLLGHKNIGLTEVRIINPNDDSNRKIKGIGFFDNPQELIKECEQWNGQSNIYVGRNPRPFSFKDEYPGAYNKINPMQTTGGKSIDVGFITCFSLDIDPIRQKNTASTNEEHSTAINKTIEVAQKYPGAFAVDSGNGGLVVLPIEPFKLDSNHNEIKEKTRIWEQAIRPIVEENKQLKLDATYDIGRLVKLPGTLSIKGEDTPDRPHRTAKIVTEPIQPYSTVLEEISKFNINPNNLSQVNLGDIKNIPTEIPKRFESLLNKNEKLKATWNGTRDDIQDKSRSGFDMALADILVTYDFSNEEIAAIMLKSPSGKGKEATSQYLIHTINKARKERMGYNVPSETNQDIKQKIQGCRITPRLKQIERLQEISELVKTDLKNIGVFYTTEYERFYFDKTSKNLINIESPDFTTLLNVQYGINKAEKEHNFVIEDIKAEIQTTGQKTEIYKFSYFDKNTFILYIFNFESQIYKITENSIELVDNGTDGILFLKTFGFEKFEFIQNTKPNEYLSMLMEHLIGKINFVSGEGVNIKPANQIYLFFNYLMSLFFESLLPTKPILLFVGIKGSGKSFTLRALGKLLFGKRFDLISLSNDKRDFISAISSNYFVAIDNVDSKIEWLNDVLASTATGQAISYRKLYTPNEEIKFYPRVFTAITSRTPKFKRDDVADRLLILKVDKIEDFISENELLTNILQNRNLIWTEIIQKLQKIIKKLKETSVTQYTSGFRMADWAVLLFRMTGQQECIQEILDKMEKEQAEFTLDEEPIFQTLTMWIEHGNEGKSTTTGDLYKELKAIAEREKIDFYYKSSQSFGIKIKHIRSNLENFFKITTHREHGNKTTYTFFPKEQK
ncbi:MAG: hypothetical protein PHX21_05890 [bacterium]|nr:hypothetical protein [bacterium]